MSENGCIHLSNFKATKGTQPFKVIYSYFVACKSTEARRRKAFSCYCYICRCLGPRLHSCLHCIFFGCFVSGHIQEHAKLKKHFLAVELTYGMVMCFQCGDYIHDREFTEIARERDVKASKALGIPVRYQSWVPTRRDIELMRLNPRRRKVAEDSIVGLRGIINMGNTCFMNCIVQALTHTPLLRDYFLSERHQCQFHDKPGCCLVCEISRLFQEFYSGNKAPLMLHRLLCLFWTHADHLAGRKQQDAHEFFIAALDILHQHCNATSGHGGPGHCKCIVDKIFSGRLQSEVVCHTCNGVSTTIDPFWDISLDLATDIASSSKHPNHKMNEKEPASLTECLQRYTQPELLVLDKDKDTWKCSNCQSYQKTTKQLTLNKLPVVASFHLKRFKHSSCFHKISTFVSFPEHLDMTPFMSHFRNMSNGHCGNGYSVLPNNRYSLFAVINHLGTMEGGHYIAFIRQQQNNWFKCNDHVITKVNIQEVLNSEGYLLFYHKQFLEYE